MPDVKVELAVAEFQLSESKRRLRNAQEEVNFLESKLAKLKTQQASFTSENVSDSRTLLNG